VNFAEQLFARGGVEIQHRERGTAGLISAEWHRGDVDAMLAKQRADPPDHSGTIRVFQHEHHALRSGFDRRLLMLTIRGVAPKNAPPTETVLPSPAAESSSMSV
jgi:hypothetical protein